MPQGIWFCYINVLGGGQMQLDFYNPTMKTTIIFIFCLVIAMATAMTWNSHYGYDNNRDGLPDHLDRNLDGRPDYGYYGYPFYRGPVFPFYRVHNRFYWNTRRKWISVWKGMTNLEHFFKSSSYSLFKHKWILAFAINSSFSNQFSTDIYRPLLQ